MSPAPTMFCSASQATWPDTWTAVPKGVGTIATCAKPYGRLSKNSGRNMDRSTHGGVSRLLGAVRRCARTASLTIQRLHQLLPLFLVQRPRPPSADHHRLHLGDVDAAEGIGLVQRLLHEARVGEVAERGGEEIAPARVDLQADGGGGRKQ